MYAQWPCEGRARAVSGDCREHRTPQAAQRTTCCRTGAIDQGQANQARPARARQDLPRVMEPVGSQRTLRSRREPWIAARRKPSPRSSGRGPLSLELDLVVEVGDARCRADLELARVHHPILAGEGPSKPGRLVPVQMVDDVRVFGVRARAQSRRCWREATTTWSGVALSQPTT